MKKKPKVGIIVLNWNRKDLTSSCLDSLKKIPYSNREIVIVDNGSVDGSCEHFREAYPDCTLLETGENLGYAGGNNVGIDYGLKQGFDYFLILNNDIVVDPNMIEAYLATFEKHPEAGILGAKKYQMDQPNQLDHFGGMWKPKLIDFEYVGHCVPDDGKSWETPQKVDYVSGSSLMIDRLVFEAIGPFDPRFFLFWEETDLCFRARRAGFAVMTAPDAKVWHIGSASFTGGKPHSTYFFWRNRLLWIERNFKGLERIYYFAKILLFNSLALYKLRLLRRLQLFLEKRFRKEADPTRNLERIKRYTAALCGTKDYLFRRFGIGNSHLFQ